MNLTAAGQRLEELRTNFSTVSAISDIPESVRSEARHLLEILDMIAILAERNHGRISKESRGYIDELWDWYQRLKDNGGGNAPPKMPRGI